MASRTVEVMLRLVTGQYKREAHEAANATDDLDRSVAKVDHDLDKIPGDAARAAAALKLLSGDVKSVGDRVDSIGAKNSGLVILDAKIRDARNEVKKLGDEFVKTGDIDVFKKLGEAEGKLRGLQDVRKKLSAAIVDGTEDGLKNMGPGFAKFWKDSFGSIGGSELKTIGITAGVILAAGAAPVIGSAVAGAILAGAAAGPMAVGIGQSLNDPGVQAELDQLSLRMGDTLQRSTTYFVPVMERAFETLGQSWGRLSPQIEQTFVNTAPLVDKMVKGVTELAENAMPGFVHATAKAGPVFDQIENTLNAIGTETGSLFEMVSEHSDEAASAVQFFGMLASGSIAVVTSTLETLLEGWGHMVAGAERGAHDFEVMFGWVPGVGSQLRSLESTLHMLNQTAHGEGATASQVYGRALSSAGDNAQRAQERVAKLKERSELLAGSFSAAAVKAGTLRAALDQLNGAAISSEQAELQYQAAIDRATQSVKDNGAAHDASTEKGRANREALLGIVTATQAKVEATYNETLATQGQAAADAAATVAAQQGRQAVIAAALSMGYSRGEAEAYANQLLKIPGNVSTMFKIYGTDVASEQIQAVKDSLARVPGSKTINITVKADLPSGMSMGMLQHQATGGIRHAATGLIVGPSDPGTMIGEPQTGGELLLPMRGITPARAASLARTGLAGYGLDVVPRDDFRGYRAHRPSPAAWSGSAAAPMHAESAAGAAGSTDARGLARAIRAALEGTTVVLDGQAVGRIQGRQSNLMRRGG